MGFFQTRAGHEVFTPLKDPCFSKFKKNHNKTGPSKALVLRKGPYFFMVPLPEVPYSVLPKCGGAPVSPPPGRRGPGD
jgi:hypothetical protein